MSRKARSSRPTSRSCAPDVSCSVPRVPGVVRQKWGRTIAMRLPELVRHSWTVAAKDLLVEFRSRTAILSVATFVVLVLMVFNFGRDPTAVSNVDLAPSILWVTFTFAAILALNRAFQLELENQALEGLLLAPIDRSSIYLGKLIANLVFVATIELIGVPLLALFFNVPVLSYLVPLSLVITLATLGFVAVGTLFSAMTVRTRFAELLLPVVLLPFMILPLMWATLATTSVLADRPLSEIGGSLKMLAGYDIVFVVVSLLLFPATVNE